MGLMAVYSLEYDFDRKCSLVKERDTIFSDEIAVNNAKTAYNIFNQVFFPATKTEEYMYLMCLDAQLKVKGLFVVSQGSINSALQNIRGIFTRALLCNATCIITAHNHPSGECIISKQDEQCYKKLKAACEIVGITLMDFLILYDWEYYSFNEKGLL